MLNRINLLLIAFAIMFLAACAGSKGGGGGGSESSADYGDESSARSEPPPKPNELKEAHEDAVSVTEENHKLAREAFELKNKLGLPTDE